MTNIITGYVVSPYYHSTETLSLSIRQKRKHKCGAYHEKFVLLK